MGQPPDKRSLGPTPADILSSERIAYCERVVYALLETHKFYQSLVPEAQSYAHDSITSIALSIMVNHDGHWRSANIKKIKDKLHHGKKKDGPLDILKDNLHRQYGIAKTSQLNQFGDDLLQRFVDMCEHGVDTIEALNKARSRKYQRPKRRRPLPGQTFDSNPVGPANTQDTSLLARYRRRGTIFPRKR